MATTSVAKHPAIYGADPVRGNFTDDSSMHLWCAQALAAVVACRDSMESWNDDIQDALRYLLAKEVARANKASDYERAERAGGVA
jgi:hypothetical protein